MIGVSGAAAAALGGLTLAPGLYKWTTDVPISKDVVLTGGPDDVWIFQIAGMIAMKTHASINGRLLAQTAVTLQMNTLVKPAL